MRPFLRSLPLLCLALLASSCSNAMMSIGRAPWKLEGKPRAEILGEFGAPVHSTRYAGTAACKICDDTFHVGGVWRCDHPESTFVTNTINGYTLGLAEVLFVPMTVAYRSKEAVGGSQLIIRYRPDARQTVEHVTVRLR